MSALLGILAAATTLFPALQSRDQYADEVRRTVRHRAADAAQRHRHHQETMRLRSELLVTESEHTIAQDMQRYRIRLALSRRQSSRDAGIQHFLLNQTVCMTAGLMLGCAFCLIGQGVLPDATVQSDNRLLMMLYSASAGIAIGCLGCAVWCSLKIQSRMTYFDHSCGLRSARRGGGRSRPNGQMPSISTAPLPHQGRTTARMDALRASSSSRDEQAAPLLYKGCHRSHFSIQDYLQCHTESLRRWATRFLQIGSLSVLFSGWAFVALTMFRLDSPSRWILLVLMAVAIIGIVVGDRMFPDKMTQRDEDPPDDRDIDPLHELGMERCLDELLEQEEDSFPQ
jgi:hypothetical protein